VTAPPPTDAAAVQGLGRPIAGPGALGTDWRRFVNLTRTLAVTDFKLKFFGSVLGYLWQLMRPLLLFGVLYVVFTEFVRLGEGVAFYPVVLLLNIVLYTYFAEATGGAVTSVIDRENLVRKIHFPRLAIPASIVTVATFNVLLNVIVVFIFAAASGVEPRLDWLQLPLILAAMCVFATGVSLIVSVLYVRFRDIKPIWDVLLQVLFYSSPILFVVEKLPSEGLMQALMFSPLAALMQQARHAVVDPDAPGAAAVAGGYAELLVPAGIVLAILGFGLWLFNREAPRIAEEL
jgi:ABC-2 type transport system permease protein